MSKIELGKSKLFDVKYPRVQQTSKVLNSLSSGIGGHSFESSEISAHGTARPRLATIYGGRKHSRGRASLGFNHDEIERNPDYVEDSDSDTVLDQSWTSTSSAKHAGDVDGSDEIENASGSSEDDDKPDKEGEEKEEEEEECSSSGENEDENESFLSSDEEAETTPLIINPDVPIEDKKWDAFAEIPRISDHEINESFFKFFRKLFKVCTYIVIFCGILLMTVVSKGSVIMAVSKLRPFPSNSQENFTQPDLSCRDYEEIYTKAILDENGTFHGTEIVPVRYTTCVTIPRGYAMNMTQSFTCLKAQNRSGKANYTMLLASYHGNECVVSRMYWAWSLYLMICTPYVFICLRNAWRLLFNSEHRSRHLVRTMLIVLAIESLHTIGLSLLIFLVFPSLDNSFQVLMYTLGVALLPASLKVLIREREEKLKQRVIEVTLGILAVIGQLSAIVVWPVLVSIYGENKAYDEHLIWSIPTSLVLISVRWWGNFIDKNSHLGRLRIHLNVLAGQIRRSRIKVQLVVSLCKMVVTLMTMMFCISIQIEHIDHGKSYSFSEGMTAVFNFDLSQCEDPIEDELSNSSFRIVSQAQLPEMGLDWMWVWLVNCCTSLVCYFFARSAAKIRIQQLSYALPLVLTTPFLVGMVLGTCEVWNGNPCSYTGNDLPGYIFHKCYEVGEASRVWLEQLWVLIVFWWLSQLWITSHIWFPKSERLAKAERLFVLPLYDGVLLEQSLLVNRARNDEPKSSRIRHFTELPWRCSCMPQQPQQFLNGGFVFYGPKSSRIRHLTEVCHRKSRDQRRDSNCFGNWHKRHFTLNMMFGLLELFKKVNRAITDSSFLLFDYASNKLID